MKSIFSNIYHPKDMCFWEDFTDLHKPETSTVFFQGSLLELSTSNVLKEKFFYLNKNSILRSKNVSSRITKISSLKWKIIEPFIEEDKAGIKYGFRLSQGIYCQYFYTKTSEELDEWLAYLSRIGIMTDIKHDYDLKSLIGSGSFANVYLAEDYEDSRTYAIKSIPKKLLLSKNNFQALCNEIEILRMIDHPGIVKLHKVYEGQNHIYLVLDYVPGGNMLQRLLKHGPLTEEKAAKFASKLLGILDYLKLMNVVHRDLKLENILLNSESSETDFKLIDFGLACFADKELTQNCGSPGYVAPEILRKMPYGAKVDVFSTGVVLYMVLSGRAPFSGKTPRETLLKNRDGIIQFQEQYWRGISREAISLVLALTKCQPSLRPNPRDALQNKWLNIYTKRQPIMTLRSPIISSRNNEKFTYLDLPNLENPRRGRLSVVSLENQEFCKGESRRGSLFPDISSMSKTSKLLWKQEIKDFV
ncbi:unnamed protein product [Blepharisma stoltei]|uniref:Protein kinase domain-containing protein n=1 Tax=Blepharisma stoltei TaxID=1481888 RepID=A0AAU9J5K5_9CILI|nr:unnamed protein product [Blepharisma stoltei]